MKKETMTGRERVYKAIRHEPVDRFPIDLGCHFSTGISVVAYQNLCEYLGIDAGGIEMADCVQCLARVEDAVAARFHIDTVLLNPPWVNPRRWNMRDTHTYLVPGSFKPMRCDDGAWIVNFGDNRLEMPAGGFFFDGAWPDFYDMPLDDKLRLFADRAERLYEETDRFTIYMGFGAYFDGLEFACDMLTDPDKCKAQNEWSLRESIAHFDKMNALFGRYVGAVVVNSDLGMQTGPMCSPASYEEICYPYLKRFCSHVHATSDIKIFMHSCGSVLELLPLIIGAGVDILNPVQISAAGMDAKSLKAAFGDKITFWGGGCDTQLVLWGKAPAEVAAHVREQAAAFKPGSGFVFAQVHNIMGNVPPENIVAMLDTAYEESWYQ
jgi:uroporphyrinogen decarboxylase